MVGEESSMWKRCVLFSGILVSIAATTQTTVPASIPSTRSKPDTRKAVSSVADLSLDSARRWTEAALTDSSNLLPMERDFLLVRLAAAWNEIDHSKSEEYLKTALEHLRGLSKQNGIARADNSGVFISDDVMTVDRNAWEQLVKELPARDASETLSNEAASQDDVAGTMELEQKSLSHGGSYRDSTTLEGLIEENREAAARLFDEMLSTAAERSSNPSLLYGLVEHAFDTDGERANAGGKSFYDDARRQRILSLLAQRALSQQESDACSYSSAASQVIEHFPAVVQGQLRPVIESCKKQSDSLLVDRTTQDAANSDNTDNLVRAMEQASDPKAKAFLRERAAFHAMTRDHDYERAIRLCLDASTEERENMPFSGEASFDEWAVNFANQRIAAFEEKPNDRELQRILDLLPAKLKAQVEINAIPLVARRDKSRALLMLSEARETLDHESPFRTDSYIRMMSETADLVPSELTLSWKVLINGLNRFEQVREIKADYLKASSDKVEWSAPFKDAIYPSYIPERAIEDENFVRASVADLNSPEYRTSLRIGVVNAFLQRYRQALKEPNTTPKTGDN
jgi:hypothetical protein